MPGMGRTMSRTLRRCASGMDGRALLDPKHRRPRIERSRKGRHHVGSEGASDHRFQAKASDVMTPRWREWRDAADLDRNRSEICETIERIRSNDNRAWIHPRDLTSRGSAQMRRKIRVCYELRQDEFLAKQPSNDETILHRRSHGQCHGPMEKSKNVLKGQLSVRRKRAKGKIGDVGGKHDPQNSSPRFSSECRFGISLKKQRKPDRHSHQTQ